VDARPIDLTKLFEPTTQYRVPLFQRPYVWEREKQWEPLWNDIRTAADRLTDDIPTNDDQPHFMGAIVLELQEARELTYKSVIDGQQRMTSVQLIIAAARGAASDAGETNLARKLETLLFFEDFLVDDPNHQFKLVPTNGDRVAFQLSTRFGITDKSRVPIGDSARIMEAYAYFRGAIDEWLAEVDEASTSQKLDALVSAIRRNLRVVVIDLDRGENAQAIFETMNARGTPLLAADLVKNQLFQDAGQSRAEFLYGKYWADFDTQTWRQEVGVGRTKRPRVDVLLGNWLMLRGEEDLHWQELFLDFQRYRSKSGLPAEDLLSDLREVASVFDMLERFPMVTREGLFMHRLDVLEANTIRPVALRMFGRGGIEDPNDRIRAVVAIESWLVRRMLCRLTTKNYNRVARALLDRIGSGSFTSHDVTGFLSGLQGESQVWPDDEMLLANLASQPYYTAITRARLRMVLEAIEADLRGPMNVAFADWNALTVEHVLPQEWAHHWPLPDDRPELEARISRDAAKHRLGNLTLVAQPLNSRLSNAAWVDGSGGKREALRAHNIYMLNKPLVDVAQWDEDHIRSRGDELAQAVLSIWPAPSGIASGGGLSPPSPAEPAQPSPSHSVVIDHSGRRRRVWDEHRALAALHEVEPDLGKLGEALMTWVDTIPDMTYVKATRLPELKPSLIVHGEPVTLLTLTTERRVYLVLESWNRVPELRDGASRRALIEELNAAVGASMRPARSWQQFPADLIYDSGRRSAFFEVMTRLAQMLRKSPPLTEATTDPSEQVEQEPSELNQRYQRFLSDVVDRWVSLEPTAVAPVVGPRNWLTVGSGRRGVTFNWSVASGRGVRVEVYIDVGDRDENKRLFDLLNADASRLESALGERLTWERLDDRRASRISLPHDADPATFDNDPELAEWAAETMVKVDRVFRPAIEGLD
jgi:hypothetical protein